MSFSSDSVDRREVFRDIAEVGMMMLYAHAASAAAAARRDVTHD